MTNSDFPACSYLDELKHQDHLVIIRGRDWEMHLTLEYLSTVACRPLSTITTIGT